MAKVSVSRLRDRARSSFWLVPALCAGAAVAAAVGAVALDELVGENGGPSFLFPGPPDGARSFLEAIISAMIAFTGIVFSITVVVLVLTSGQFSPRVLRTFLRDRVIQWSLGIFVATFVYAMTVIRTIEKTTDGGAFVPRIGVTIAFGLVLVSVATFIVYIDHIANVIRVSSIIASIGAESRDLLERRCPSGHAAGPPEPDLSTAPPSVVANRRAGVVVSVHESALVERAAGAECVVLLVPRVGDFVPAGAPLLTVYGRDWPEDLPDRLLALVALDDERTMEQDLAFAFRQLVDIAEKALSPAINDPTTACQAIDMLHDLLRRLATRAPPAGRVADARGAVRLVVPQYEFVDYLELTVSEIWCYGRDGAQIPARLRSMLHDLDQVTRPDDRLAVRRWLSVLQGGDGSAGGSGRRPF